MDWLEELQKEKSDSKQQLITDLYELENTQAYQRAFKQERLNKARLKQQQKRDAERKKELQKIEQHYIRSAPKIDALFTKIMEYALKANEVGKFGIIAEDQNVVLILKCSKRQLELVPYKRGLVARVTENGMREKKFSFREIDDEVVSGFVQWIATGTGVVLSEYYC